MSGGYGTVYSRVVPIPENCEKCATAYQSQLGSGGDRVDLQQLRAKFDDNAGDLLSPAQRDRLADAIAGAEHLPDARTLVEMSIGRSR